MLTRPLVLSLCLFVTAILQIGFGSANEVLVGEADDLGWNVLSDGRTKPITPTWYRNETRTCRFFLVDDFYIPHSFVRDTALGMDYRTSEFCMAKSLENPMMYASLSSFVSHFRSCN